MFSFDSWLYVRICTCRLTCLIIPRRDSDVRNTCNTNQAANDIAEICLRHKSNELGKVPRMMRFWGKSLRRSLDPEGTLRGS